MKKHSPLQIAFSFRPVQYVQVLRPAQGGEGLSALPEDGRRCRPTGGRLGLPAALHTDGEGEGQRWKTDDKERYPITFSFFGGSVNKEHYPSTSI